MVGPLGKIPAEHSWKSWGWQEVVENAVLIWHKCLSPQKGN